MFYNYNISKKTEFTSIQVLIVLSAHCHLYFPKDFHANTIIHFFWTMDQGTARSSYAKNDVFKFSSISSYAVDLFHSTEL